MTPKLLDFVLERLDRRTPHWTEVAKATGVPYDTLKKIASRSTPNPGVRTVQAIADYFVEQEAGRVDSSAGATTPEEQLHA